MSKEKKEETKTKKEILTESKVTHLKVDTKTLDEFIKELRSRGHRIHMAVKNGTITEIKIER